MSSQELLMLYDFPNVSLFCYVYHRMNTVLVSLVLSTVLVSVVLSTVLVSLVLNTVLLSLVLNTTTIDILILSSANCLGHNNKPL